MGSPPLRACWVHLLPADTRVGTQPGLWCFSGFPQGCLEEKEFVSGFVRDHRSKAGVLAGLPPRSLSRGQAGAQNQLWMLQGGPFEGAGLPSCASCFASPQ